MAKRMQEQKGERSVAVSKSTATNLSSHVPTSSLSAKSPIASQSPGILVATGKPVSRTRGNSESDAVSSSQARLKDAYFGWLIDKATVKTCRNKRGTRECGPFRIWSWEWRRCDMETVCFSIQLRGNPMHPVNQTAREVQKLKRQNGHTIYACHQPQFITWKPSSQSSGACTDENMKTLWMMWTWIWPFGAYFWILLFEQQFIFDSVTSWYWKSWSVNKKKSLV